MIFEIEKITDDMVSEGAFLGNLAILLSAIDPKTKVLLVFPWLDSQAPVQDPSKCSVFDNVGMFAPYCDSELQTYSGKINHNCGASSNRLSKTILTFRYLMQKPVCYGAMSSSYRWSSGFKRPNHLSKYGATFLTSDLNSEIK